MLATPNYPHVPRVYSVKSAALKLSCSTKTVFRLMAADKIKWVRLTERKRVIPAEEIERIAAEGV